MSELDRAADAIESGALVVYPTETVYGLAAAALEPNAVERVFEVKGRDRSKPLSLAVPSVPSALQYVRATERERRFMATFLPGPVTVLCRRREAVPDELTAGRDRVGVRVPDHDLALALCERAGTPITATSANVSGRESARRLADLDPEIREAAAVVLDGGDEQGSSARQTGSDDCETDGTESTVVNVSSETIHRRGAQAAEIEAWLEDS
ncbi:L-threonylcarbamoyladenylate synthase [Natrinema sp. SYSU A 869]|uniref:L-threonylcarbamoyladenylate synthase n=1 Tax=Natrinema sp. SYSU A 869 TaxID=2871694 RepID=UPI001CA460D1|nr:L-threonylcarbamoyladenylate synthase [Natrinema sp. SYSU A 869]